MKLKFKQQSYQNDAAQAVVKCFEGQKKGHRKDIADRKVTDDGLFGKKEDIRYYFSNNELTVHSDDVLKNVQALQQHYGLKVKEKLEGFNFTIEMETGTGKTYVYTKTMYELNKHFGWNKFIIMVPSIAIREGVHKSLEITSEHFQELYGQKIRFHIYNTKNKSNLVNIKNFANTSNIEVIIMNYQAFATSSKESRKIFQQLDSLQSERPIDIIKRTNPILIIDEPQRFGQKAEKIFTEREFNQLFTLRYSATHKHDFNKIYRLDAVDAYNHKLVKKINVKGIEVVGDGGTNSYLFLDRIQVSNKQYPTAFIELDVKQENGVHKKIRKVEEKDDLYVKSNGLNEYEGFVVREINAKINKVSFTNGVEIFVGQSIGDVNEDHVRRIQIREAIASHLEKERLMYPRGIKVLSLFFIDEVAKYRDYEAKDNKGEYARIFEEEYEKAIAQNELFDQGHNDYIRKKKTEQIHEGYFSIDKKGNFVDSKEKRLQGTSETGSDDEGAYELIMKNKEKLLSFSEPTRFIFSHSALREGWDNPNVFQICTLKHSQSNISKRQEIGRGLRICVNQEGERMDSAALGQEFFDVNKLTVVASESYDNFAKALQTEIVESLSERPAKLNTEALKNRMIKNEKGATFTFDDQASMDLIFDFKMKGYIDKNYHITETLLEDIEKDKFQVPDDMNEFKAEIGEMMQTIYSTANYKATDNEKANNVHETVLKPNENFAKKEFQDLWKKIKIKTVYEVDFDSDELVEKCVLSLDANLSVKKLKVYISSGEQQDEFNEQKLRYGNIMSSGKTKTEQTDTILGDLPYDLIGELAKNTNLTRKTIVRILKGISSATFRNFTINPESFIHECSKLINNEKAATLINNITYSKTDQTYDDSIFTINNFKGKLDVDVLEVKNHIHDYVKTDSSTIEKPFAEALDNDNDVIVYAKLPAGSKGFQIPTPVGNYSPDWAIVFDTEKYKYVYFIAETKGSMETLNLKGIEDKKIDYARKHFAAIEDDKIKYDVVDSFEALRDKVLK